MKLGMYKYLVAAFGAVLLTIKTGQDVRAQKSILPDDVTAVPQVGKVLPSFELKNVQDFSKKDITNNDLKGKWLFLDFWFKNCVPCITSLPVVNEYQKRFKDTLNYVLVGFNRSRDNEGIEELYQKLKEKNDLSLISAFDSNLVKRWGIFAMPYIIIVDPTGVVRAITNGSDLTAEKIQALVDNKTPQLYDAARVRYSFGKDLFNEKNMDTSVIVKTALTRHKDEVGTYAPIDLYINIPKFKVKGYYISSTSLRTLYFISEIGFDPGYLNVKDSLYGTYFPIPVLNIKDSSNFKKGKRVDNAPGYYNYSMVVNEKMANRETMMRIMKADLENAFGYETKIEKRDVGVWHLISLPGAKERLKTRYKVRSVSDSLANQGAMGFKAKNESMRNVLMRIQFYTNQTLPLVDSTGITSNIDIEIRANMTNIQDIRRELNRNGLDLIKKVIEMKFLVISDPFEMVDTAKAKSNPQ